MEHIKNIVLIGAGNVATHLGYALEKGGFQIVQVYSRTKAAAQKLADDLYTDFTTDLHSIRKDGDLYIISVRDSAVKNIAEQLQIAPNPVVHTSGSLDLEILKQTSDRRGVFYPLQTFSKSRNTQFKTIPICLEANSEELLAELENMAGKISDHVQRINTERRRILHLAAVFACNFPNFMYTIAEEIVEQGDFNFDILRPLIKETTEKIMINLPIESQTGPAIRNDQNIMNKHLEMLQAYPAYQKLYEMISREIHENSKKGSE
ncbi:MAG: DUF2520 domain-containing protein [Bacteroidetes bacterium]|nr:DUF2520 domain-containing protein [Bacteroidota bacterium]